MSAAATESMLDDYLQLLEKYETIYGGAKMALMYQCGSFYELYGIRHAGEFIKNPQIEEITQICNLALVEKKQTYGRAGAAAAVYMAGVRDYILQKYLSILSDAGYTIVVYSQHREGSKHVRKLDYIVSCGTNISTETDATIPHSNYIMCLWFERATVAATAPVVVAAATINIFTGKSYFFEYTAPSFRFEPATFDELEHQISIFAPSEIIIVSDFSRAELEKVVCYSNIKSPLIHYHAADCEKAANCAKQSYVKHCFDMYFRGRDRGAAGIWEHCAEFQENIIATQAFCYLMDFIYEHNPNMIQNIHLPELQTTASRLILGNQTLKQLNIIEDGSMDGKRAGKCSSVLNFLNCTCSPMGRRQFQHEMVSPIFDETRLAREYAITAAILSSSDGAATETAVRATLSECKDVEKINRQIVIQKIYPSSLYHLYDTLQKIRAIATTATKYIEHLSVPQFEPVLDFFYRTFCMDVCRRISSMSAFDGEMIFAAGVFPTIDKIYQKYTNAVSDFATIHRYLNSFLTETDAVKIHETDKNGASFQITKRRGVNLRAALEKTAAAAQPPPTLSSGAPLALDEIKFATAAGGGSADEITSPQIKEICKYIATYREELSKHLSVQYLRVLTEIKETYYAAIECAADFAAAVDVIFCKSFIARKYNLCRPQIDAAAPAAFVRARDLRHILIENLNQSVIYVPNDVGMDTTTRGMLIYGVNTTGKTSYIRSVGISVIMAQCGLWVPAREFIYKPYRAIFSRILGNDNLFQGLSSFAVEMSELRVILKNATTDTLVIGDEICSGTENQSAISIFVAALLELLEKRCSFLFATHFHEIVDYDEIAPAVAGRVLDIKHISVVYDRERDCLIYERKLRDSAGCRVYGVEIAKSMHLPTHIIERAYQLRNKYYSETKGALSHKSTKYNASKVRGLCEMCGKKMSEEVHHIAPQCVADDAGIIRSENGAVFHKNHLQNLMSLCEGCHLKMHHSGGGAVAAEDIEPPKPICGGGITKKRATKKTRPWPRPRQNPLRVFLSQRNRMPRGYAICGLCFP